MITILLTLLGFCLLTGLVFLFVCFIPEVEELVARIKRRLK